MTHIALWHEEKFRYSCDENLAMMKKQADTVKKTQNKWEEEGNSGIWLVKQEPSAYSWQDFVREGGTAWTGVRNFQARHYLSGMSLGDEVLFYHSVRGKCIVGLARVRKTAYLDPTAKEENWVCVDLEPVHAFARPVSLEMVKAHPLFQDFPLVRQSRLSVMPVKRSQFLRILKWAGK